MKTMITEEALADLEVGFEILEFHMEGDVRVITKARLLEVSIGDDLHYDITKIKQLDTSDWF